MVLDLTKNLHVLLQYTATQSMDVPLIIWKGMSLLDLAMHAKCERFIEECCASALDDLFTGVQAVSHRHSVLLWHLWFRV